MIPVNLPEPVTTATLPSKLQLGTDPGAIFGVIRDGLCWLGG